MKNNPAPLPETFKVDCIEGVQIQSSDKAYIYELRLLEDAQFYDETEPKKYYDVFLKRVTKEGLNGEKIDPHIAYPSRDSIGIWA